MAKFCGNCGAQMDDNAAVCGFCGASLNSGSSSAMNSFKVDDPEKKKKIKKYVTIGASVVAVIVVASVLISVIVNNTGYKGCLKKTMAAFEKTDSSAFDKIVTGVINDLDSDEADEYMSYMIENQVDSIKDKFEDKVGHNYKLSYEVDEYFELEGRKFDKFVELYEDNDEISVSIEKVQIAEVTVTAKKDKKSDDCEIQVVMTKEDGSWKLFSILPEDTY